MIVIISGAATILAGAITFSLFRYRTSDNTVDTLLEKLSESGQQAMDEVNAGPDPCGPETPVSWRDMYAIFRNSRQLVMITNRARLGHLTDEELPFLLESLQEDHAKMRWLLFLVAIESFVGRLGIGQITHYTRELLWTYGDELELLDQITEKFRVEGTAIQAIL